jgi:hypothetical protein
MLSVQIGEAANLRSKTHPLSARRIYDRGSDVFSTLCGSREAGGAGSRPGEQTITKPNHGAGKF